MKLSLKEKKQIQMAICYTQKVGKYTSQAKKLLKCTTLRDFMDYMRKCSFDLPSTLKFLSQHLTKLEKPACTQKGSCQDYLLRLVAQLVYYYKIPAKQFENWDT